MNDSTLKKNRDLPATIGHLDRVSRELKGEISSNRHEISALAKTVQALESKMDSRFEAFEARMEARFEVFEKRMDARFSRIDAKIERMLALYKEQNTRNKYVMDGYTTVHHAQIELAEKYEELEQQLKRVDRQQT